MSIRQCLIFLAIPSVLFVVVTGCGDSTDLAPVLTRVEANISCGYVPMDVQFVAIASGGDPVTDPTGGNAYLDYDWDFGDGTRGSGSVTTHRFLTPDIYDVTIAVKDDDGDSVTETLTIEVRADSMIVTTSPDTVVVASLARFATPTLGASNSSVAADAIGGLSINEVLIFNDSIIRDSSLNFKPVLEIFNSSSVSISLDPYALAIDLIDPSRRYEFGSVPVVLPGEYQLVWLDGTALNTDQPHTNFNILSGFEGEPADWDGTIYLLRNNVPVDSINLGPQLRDVSFGRTEDGSVEGTVMLKVSADICGFDTQIGDYTRFDFLWSLDDTRSTAYTGRQPLHMFTTDDIGERQVTIRVFDTYSSVYRTATVNVTVQ